MISYVLVMIVSLATGQPTHAALEGPMSTSWCEQLIKRDVYSGEDATTRKSPSCLSWPDAQRVLAQNSCKQTPGPSPRWPSIQFDCATPAPAPAPDPDPDPGPVPAAPAPGPAAPGAASTPEPTPDPAPAADPAPDPDPPGVVTPDPDPVSVPAPAPAPAPEPPLLRQETYLGVLVRERNVIVAPKTFPVSDCPGSINATAGDGNPVYMRCLSLVEHETLLNKAKCSRSSVNESGNLSYECNENPALYIDGLSRQ
jgi:hypothetical protein